MLPSYHHEQTEERKEEQDTEEKEEQDEEEFMLSVKHVVSPELITPEEDMLISPNFTALH